MNPTDRMPPLSDAEMTAEQREAIADFKQTRGTLEFHGPFVPLLRSPELLRNAQRVGEYLRYRSALPQHLRELAILVTARHWYQRYEWGIHAPIAAEAGVSGAIIAAVADGRRPAEMASDQATLHDFCVELLRNQSVSDPTYKAAVRHFTEHGVVDLVGILGYYSLLAMVMNTARTALPETMSPSLQPLPYED